MRPATSRFATPSEATLFSYWSIKPWFRTEGRLAAVLSTHFSWGSQLALHITILCPLSAHQQVFWRRCRGERSLLQGESLTLNLFILLLLLFLLSYFILFAALNQKSKKISLLFIVVIFIACLITANEYPRS